MTAEGPAGFKFLQLVSARRGRMRRPRPHRHPAGPGAHTLALIPAGSQVGGTLGHPPTRIGAAVTLSQEPDADGRSSHGELEAYGRRDRGPSRIMIMMPGMDTA